MLYNSKPNLLDDLYSSNLADLQQRNQNPDPSNSSNQNQPRTPGPSRQDNQLKVSPGNNKNKDHSRDQY